MRAPKGPAAANAPPEPKNNPVPMVPAIYTKLSGEGQKKMSGKPTAILRSIVSLVPSEEEFGLHLNMALLETSLDMVKVMDIKVESTRQ